MALINSPVLPAQASEALKSPVMPSANQAPVAPDAFSQTLREKMAQAKPASPDNKPSSPQAETESEQAPTAQTPREQPENTADAKGNAGATVTQAEKHTPTRSGKSAAKAKTEDTSNQANQAGTDTSRLGADDTVVNTTASLTDAASAANGKSDDKKINAGGADESGAATAGIMPWMQTMLAMRASQPADNAKGSAEGAGFTIGTGRFAATGLDKTLPQQGAADVTQASAATDKEALMTAAKGVQDGKQLVFPTKSDKAAEGFAALLANNKSASAEMTLPKGMEQALRAHESTPGNAVFTPPVLMEAMQNAPWLQSAGVTDMSQVVATQITTPFTDERWQAAINQHVMQMASQSDEVASLTLSPPDLGPIQVVLKVDNQSVNPSFISDNPLVRQALEDGMQDLRDRMQSQGLQLGQTFVGNGQQAQQHFEQQSGRENARASASASDTDTAITPQTAVQPRVVRGLVDTFV